MLIFSFGIVVALLGLSLFVLHSYVERQIQKQVVENLQETSMVFSRFIDDRLRTLRAQCEVVAADPRFTAMLDREFPDPGEHVRTVLPIARQFQSLIDSDLFIVTNDRGESLGHIEMIRSVGRDLRSMPTISKALAGVPGWGTWQLEEGVFHVATVPVSAEGEGWGSVTVGSRNPVDAETLVDYLVEIVEREAWRNVDFTDQEILDNLFYEVSHTFAGDVTAITDRYGWTVNMMIARSSSGQDMTRELATRAALAGDQYVGLTAYNERLYQMVVLPVWSQDDIIGSLGAGFAIDDRLAGDVSRMTNTEISFALGDRLIASTWPAEMRSFVERDLENRATLERGDVLESQLDGETYLTLAEDLDSSAKLEEATYLIQLSLDRAAGFLMQLELVLLLIGIGVLVGAAALSLPLASRIVRPLQALVEATRRLSTGDFSHQIRAEGGEVGALATSFNEMATALEQSHEAITESELKYRDLFDNAEDLAYTTDMEMRFTSVNKAGVETLGYGETELLGRTLYSLLPTEEEDRMRIRDRRLKPGSTRPPFETEVICKDGRQVPVEIVSRWIAVEGGFVGTHAIARDVTQRRERDEATQRFHEQLHQAEKLRALGELAAGVAHNFNNLLTVVMGNAELIGMRDDIPENIRKDTDRIRDSARSCASIVRRIQNFGRPIDLEARESLDLNQIITDTIDITRPRWKTDPEREGRSIRFDLHLGQLPPVITQGAAWEEILSNLIFNAVDAMPEGGNITISTRKVGTDVEVRVADTGVGMDAETKRRLFEPFFTTKDPEHGTGLGLSTVWGLIRGLGGLVEIESEPAIGSTFILRVPAPQLALPGDEETAAATILSQKKILIIDDDTAVLDLLASFLPEHDVATAAGGSEGLELLEKETFEMVITDWVMPDVTGLDVAAKVKEGQSETVLIIMTGWDYEGTAVEQSPQVDLILAKPFDREKVNLVLNEAAVMRLDWAGELADSN